MRRCALLASLSSVVVAVHAHAQASPQADCSTILPRSAPAVGTRPLTPEDLVRLRDIGPAEPETFAEPLFTISPDGTSAAFQLRRADPQHNGYCVAMVVVDLVHAGRARVVDEGSEPLLFTFDLRGITNFPIGLMRVITPRWSPDGKWFAFLKRTNGKTQVWRAFSDARPSTPLTHAEIDVVDFAITDDGSSVIYATRPGIEKAERETDVEGLRGWHFDDRFVPFLSKRPLIRALVGREAHAVDLATGEVRAASASEAALVSTDHRIIAAAGEPALTGDRSIEIVATELNGGAAQGALRARAADGLTHACTAASCEGARTPWRMGRSNHVGFLRREGWARSSTAIYDWDVSTGKVVRRLATDDVLSSCTPSAGALVCLVDSSLQPRRLVRLDPVTARRETLFDPNPEFAHLALGKSERLHWRTPSGVETIGDLVLPVNYRPGTRYPLIVVQYDTRGFLRGGTDDEYPIQAFANRGYAVLSFSTPSYPAESKAKDFEEAGRIDLNQFGYRRHVQEALEAGVKLIVERGIADPHRLGITGLSDGSSTVEWELNHSSLFSAAALSSCCWNPSFVAYVGPSAAKHFVAEGYPGILGRKDAFWNDAALEDNARRLAVPMLLNVSEEEFLTALETYTALREAHQPVDMFIYPGEYHARWQPAHRLATYLRSLDWFDYWLRGVRSDAPDRQTELQEWDRLREEQRQKSGI